MNVFVVTSNYFDSGYFGIYSTLKRARIAFEDLGDYCYQFTTKIGETFGAEICWDYLDEEFEEGICKED